ncbi:hypothetical protein FS837_006216, partial [Tulasnella sp. UAMH 9824]
MQRLDAPILGTLVLHSYSHPPLSNLAGDKGQLPELKLIDQIIPVIRLQTACVQDLPPLIQKIPKYAQHKLELCVLAPRLRQNGEKSWDWLKEHVPKAELMKMNDKGKYERHPACKGHGLPSLNEVVAHHSSGWGAQAPTLPHHQISHPPHDEKAFMAKESTSPALIIAMGVSGSGKSTLGQNLASALGIPFYDGDSLHPQSN